MFIDRILDSDLKLKKDALRSAEVILADNVSDYFYQSTDQDYWDILKDFPNCAPPFEKVFIEWKPPTLINTGKEKNILPNELMDIKRFGCVINSAEIPTGNDRLEDIIKTANLRWVSKSTTFLENRASMLAPSISYTWFVKQDGSIWLPTSPKNPENVIWQIDTENKILAKSLAANPELGTQMTSHFLFVALLTLCFVNCKNTRLIVHEPSEKQNKSRTKKGKIPLFRYHILDIEPMKTILENEGNSKIDGLKKALHICRGHFKDFSQGKGLFGKYKGFYWWDAQLRGNTKQGFVDKDYKIDLGKLNN